jgi:hypothetical protein
LLNLQPDFLERLLIAVPEYTENDEEESALCLLPAFHKPFQKGAVVPEFSRCRYRVKEARVFEYPKLLSVRISSTLFTK